MTDIRDILEPVRLLGSHEPRARTAAAIEISDEAKHLGPAAPAVAGMIVALAVVEPDDGCLQQFLDTLLDIVVFNDVPLAVLELLHSRPVAHAWEPDYRDQIFENANYRAQARELENRREQ